MQILPPPRAGDLVRVRCQRWRVVDVRAYDDCQEIILAGAGDGTLGSTRRVIAPFETIDSLDECTRVRTVPLKRWRRACRALLADVSPPGALRAARRARIDLLPHQLEPSLAVVRGLGSRVLLADEVGLGKTIQAALVLSELRARGLAERALILAPASLRDQWANELHTRFDMEATVVDARELRRRLVTLPVGVNPWSTVPVAVASLDYVKRPEALQSVGACRWDVLVVDEAHASAGDSDRHAAVAALAARSAYVLLLTATPHSGDPLAFSSLCASGAHEDRLLVFRRTRADVCLGTRRRVHRLHVRPSEAERRMHDLVADFGSAARQAWCRGKGEEKAAWLALAVLNKRALSSARSLLRTVERRLARLTSTAPDAEAMDATERLRQIALPLLDPEGDIDDTDRPPDLPSFAFDDPHREQMMLGDLADAAREAAASETKIAALARFLRRVREPAIVFTEYRDTLLQLRGAIGRPTAVLHGGLTREERAAALDDFTSLRRSILLATDAAAEGLNLQHACRIVINLELPWNPMRLEQRIGRVDRIGQRRTVHAFHLIARDTAETRILERLRARVARAQAAIGASDPLGPDDEAAITRFVIGGGNTAEPGTRTKTMSSEPEPGNRESVRESLRLAEARRLTVARDEDARARLEADGTWITFTACRKTKVKLATLGARLLLIFRAVLEDPAGRHVESTLVPIAIGWQRGRPARIDADLLKALTPTLVSHADQALASWRHQATTITRALIDTRLLRERAMATLADRTVVTFQPGLFDRRAEREHLAARQTRRTPSPTSRAELRPWSRLAMSPFGRCNCSS
jgi:superfamily II DNA or RNA helicase